MRKFVKGRAFARGAKATLDLLFFFSVTSNSQALPLLTASCINDSADRAVINGAGIMAETVARVAGDDALRHRLETRA